VLLGVVPRVVPEMVPGVVPERCSNWCPNGILQSPVAQPLPLKMVKLELLLGLPLVMELKQELLPVAAGSLHGRCRRGCRLGE